MLKRRVKHLEVHVAHPDEHAVPAVEAHLALHALGEVVLEFELTQVTHTRLEIGLHRIERQLVVQLPHLSGRSRR